MARLITRFLYYMRNLMKLIFYAMHVLSGENIDCDNSDITMLMLADAKVEFFFQLQYCINCSMMPVDVKCVHNLP